MQASAKLSRGRGFNRMAAGVIGLALLAATAVGAVSLSDQFDLTAQGTIVERKELAASGTIADGTERIAIGTIVERKELAAQGTIVDGTERIASGTIVERMELAA